MSGFGPPPGATEGELRSRPPSYLAPSARLRSVDPALRRRYAVPTFGRPGIIPLKPLGLGDILDGSVKHVRRNPGPVIGASAVTMAIAAVPLLIAVLVAVGTPLLVSLRLNRVVDAGSLTWPLSFGGIGLAGVVLTGVLAPAVGQAALGVRLDLGQIWAALRPSLWRLLALSVLLLLTGALPWLLVVGALALAANAPVPLLLAIGFLGGAAALVFTVVVLPRLALATTALVAERSGIRAAVRRSWQLSRGRYLMIVGSILIALGISFAVFWVLELPQLLIYNLLLDQLELARPTRDSAGGFAFTLANLGAGAVVVPFPASVVVLTYLDARIRKEGFDLVLAREASERASR